MLLLVLDTTLLYPSVARSSSKGLASWKNRRTITKHHDHALKRNHPEHAVSSIRGGWSVPVPASDQLAKFYVGFNALNGAVMAVVPTIAASGYGSALDSSKGSLLAALLLERQGDAVLGTSILLGLSTYTDVSIAHTVALSALPYVLSVIKSVMTGQSTMVGLDPRVLFLSLLVPMVASLVTQGEASSRATTILVSLFVLLGAAGSLDPVRTGGLERLDLTGPGAYNNWFFVVFSPNLSKHALCLL